MFQQCDTQVFLLHIFFFLFLLNHVTLFFLLKKKKEERRSSSRGKKRKISFPCLMKNLNWQRQYQLPRRDMKSKKKRSKKEGFWKDSSVWKSFLILFKWIFIYITMGEVNYSLRKGLFEKTGGEMRSRQEEE